MKDQSVDHRPDGAGPGQAECALVESDIHETEDDEIEDDEDDDEVNPDDTDGESDFDGREDDEAAEMTTESPELTEE